MAEKPPAFIVVDKRKFTSEGMIREGYVAPEPEPERAAPAEDLDFSSAKVVTMPARTPEAATDATASADDLAGEDMAGSLRPMGATTHAGQPASQAFHGGESIDGYGAGPGRAPGAGMSAGQDSDLLEDDLEQEDGTLDSTFGDEPIGLPRSAAETAAQASAYQQSSRELDAMLQQANPGMQAPGAVGFEHLVQSFYLSAIMAMGAATEPGQKPRIDILGARQSIDLLAVLEEKTRGNLSPEEQQLMQGISFELRMMFLELTNAISKQAHQPGAAGMGQPGRMPPGGGGLR